MIRLILYLRIKTNIDQLLDLIAYFEQCNHSVIQKSCWAFLALFCAVLKIICHTFYYKYDVKNANSKIILYLFSQDKQGDVIIH